MKVGKLLLYHGSDQQIDRPEWNHGSRYRDFGQCFYTTYDRETAEDRLDEESEKQQLAEALSELPERERQMLSLYYYEGLTLKEIGAVMGVSESRVSQIHGKGLSMLRTILRAKMNAI